MRAYLKANVLDLKENVKDLKANVLDMIGSIQIWTTNTTKIFQIHWKSPKKDVAMVVMSLASVRRKRHGGDNRWRWWIFVKG